MPFDFEKLEIPDVILIKARSFADHRGYFLETYKRSEFAAQGISPSFIQVNRSHSARGVLRGLHYQIHPRAQGKLVVALTGEIFDVAVDIRRGSPTYGRWIGQALTAENRRMLYIPEGFAHGFCVLSAQADVLYQVTEEYAPQFDCGILWNDPEIGIDWPVAEPILSRKDAELPPLREASNNFAFEQPAG
jgi:dTDP-4-dehydrorhamnose 3,5-epimerase